MDSPPRAALVHEWLVRWGGSESVLVSLSRILGDAPIHTLVHHPDERVEAAFRGRVVRASGLTHLPGASRLYPAALPVMPDIWRRTQARAQELVLSSSHAFCKGIDTRGVTHVCYCHTPPRYLWDLSQEYVGEMSHVLARPLLGYLKARDREAADGVDHFIANSSFVADRIRRAYGRGAHVIYPPVDVQRFVPRELPRRHFLAGGRLVRYKRVDRAIAAANETSLPLIVFGDGPDRGRLEAMAGPSVRFVGPCTNDQLLELMQGAIALVFPGVEDFGILPVEAQAAGTPVVAFARGGAVETVADERTGVLYSEDSLECLSDAWITARDRHWDAAECRRNAERFSRRRFEREVIDFLTRIGFQPPGQLSSDWP